MILFYKEIEFLIWMNVLDASALRKFGKRRKKVSKESLALIGLAMSLSKGL